jgi:hypothetical protein
MLRLEALRPVKNTGDCARVARPRRRHARRLIILLAVVALDGIVSSFLATRAAPSR